MSSNSAPSTQNRNVTRLSMGEYETTVSAIKVLPFGDRPVIFTTLTTEDGRQITHAVRMYSGDAYRIGLQELRTGFPNQLGNLDADGIVVAMNRGVVLNHRVKAAIVPQMKNGIPVKLDNGEPAYNVKLYAIEAMSEETLRAALARLAMSTKIEDDAITTA